MTGDRECPECEEITLVENGIRKWECLKCGSEYDEEWLDLCEAGEVDMYGERWCEHGNMLVCDECAKRNGYE